MITLIDTRSYKHFVVIRRVDDRFVYVSDPSFGNRRIPLEDFEASWNRVIFVVTGPVSGQPEGLYAERLNLTLPKYEALQAANIWQRFSMDPSMSLLWTSPWGHFPGERHQYTCRAIKPGHEREEMMNPNKLGKNMKIYRYKVFVALGLVLASMTGCAGALPSQSAGLVETLPIPQTYKGVSEPQLVETPEILQTCAAMPSGELQEYRGCYASYFFGMDVGINVTGNSAPGISVGLEAMVPDGSSGVPVASPAGNQVSFNDGQVSYSAGIGNTSLGSGIFQVVQVAGNNNLVVSNMNININVANATSLIPKTNALSFTGHQIRNSNHAALQRFKTSGSASWLLC